MKFPVCAVSNYACEHKFGTYRKSVSVACGAWGDLKREGLLESLPTVMCQRVRCGSLVAVLHAEPQLHDDEHKAAYTCDAGFATSDNKTTFETYCEDTESVLQGNDSVCMANERGIFSGVNGSVEPMKLSFRDVGVATCIPDSALPGGVECNADAHLVTVRAVEDQHGEGFSCEQRLILVLTFCQF